MGSIHVTSPLGCTLTRATEFSQAQMWDKTATVPDSTCLSSSTTTSAEVSHMLVMASSSMVTRSLRGGVFSHDATAGVEEVQLRQ